MIINDELRNYCTELKNTLNSIIENNSLTELQIENFLKNFEKTRFNILGQVKLHNKNVEFEYEKIKTIDDEYKAELKDNILKIYVPEVMPSYKNLKTHTYKRILLNVAEITKKYAETFENEIFIYIKVYDNILGWDIDNKCVKPIADALIQANVIKDDNITKMFYCAKGEYSEIPHTEIFVFESKEINNFLEKYST